MSAKSAKPLTVAIDGGERVSSLLWLPRALAAATCSPGMMYRLGETRNDADHELIRGGGL
jgi:hypothetical protein